MNLLFSAKISISVQTFNAFANFSLNFLFLASFRLVFCIGWALFLLFWFVFDEFAPYFCSFSNFFGLMPNARRRSSLRPLVFCFVGLAIVLCSVRLSLLLSRFMLKPPAAVDVVAFVVGFLADLFCSFFFNTTAIDTGALGVSTALFSTALSCFSVSAATDSAAVDSGANVVTLDDSDSAALSLHLSSNDLLLSCLSVLLLLLLFFSSSSFCYSSQWQFRFEYPFCLFSV